jgi:SAM-dependent methyltransferase
MCPMQEIRFTHNNHFSDYMEIIFEKLKNALKKPSKILDIPAGFGLTADKLRTLGHDVVCADINEERPDYIQANMEFKLPFEDGAFDVVICMEGIEHVINQNALLAELVRVTKKAGLICISTPNISNFWSRLTQLLTGYFYQFSPSQYRVAKADVLTDKGHISPISLYQLGYFMAVAGAGLSSATGNHFKKKILFPLAIFFLPFAYLSARAVSKKLPSEMFAKPESRMIYFNLKVFLSRSLIAFFVKK